MADAQVPFGTSTTFPIALIDGGPVTILYGVSPPLPTQAHAQWILVSLISTCIAASLAEICSVYPTSGGVYCEWGERVQAYPVEWEWERS